MNPTRRRPTHDLLWDSPLQDCLDDCSAPVEGAKLEQHLAHCSQCRDRQDDLRRIDGMLRAWIGRPCLGESFDRKLLALADAQAVT